MDHAHISIGEFHIYWYSIIMMISVLTAVLLILKEAKKQKINLDFMSDLIFYTIPIGILGARLYYVIFNWDHYGKDPWSIFKIWEGGLAIHGAILAGSIFIIFYTLRKQVNTLKIFDISVIGLMVGQIIGRWGNFMNGEAYGRVTTYATLKKQLLPNFIIEGMNIDGIYRQPTFLYESMWNLLGLIILVALREKVKIKVGVLTCLYLVWYGFGRFFIEIMRNDALTIYGARIAQIVSFFMVAGGIISVIVINNLKLPYYQEGTK